MNKRNFIIGDKPWFVEFKCPPQAIWPDNVNSVKLENGVVTVDRLETNNELKQDNVNRICNKIQDDINNLHIEFNDRQDYSIRGWMQKWIDSMKDEFKEEESWLMKYFELSPDEQHTGSISMRLKKPLDKLTEEEKQEIRDMLCEITDLDEEEVNSLIV